MRCFVAREYSVSTEVICSIDKVLEELSIERIDAFSGEPGESVGTSLRSMILESDFIIAILSSTSPDVLFEVGLAVGSNKSVFLLAEENMVLPFNLKGTTLFESLAGTQCMNRWNEGSWDMIPLDTEGSPS